MDCRSLMLSLHRAGHLELPPVRCVNPNPLGRCGADRKKPIRALADTTTLSASLAGIMPIEFRQIRRTWQEALSNSLLNHCQ